MPILAKTYSEGISGLVQQPLSLWWLGFAGALFLPVCALWFLTSGPHGALAALAWTGPVWLVIAADRFGPSERRQVPSTAPRWFFDGLLYALVILQVLNIAALGWMVSQLVWATPADWGVGFANLLAVRIVMGTNSCCAAIAPAHELIHRRSKVPRLLGRLLLMTVFYDHFYIAHARGHHAHLGSHQDPSTAHLDESYEAFFRRSLVRQWRLALRRKPHAVWWGVAAEVGLLGLLYGLFGPLAAAVLIYQAVVAVRLLEAVNYFQHFGLTVDSGRAANTAWTSDSAVSLFMFLGLNRHVDHHRHPGVAYSDLRSFADGPQLPYGYLGMALWVKNRNIGYRRRMADYFK